MMPSLFGVPIGISGHWGRIESTYAGGSGVGLRCEWRPEIREEAVGERDSWLDWWLDLFRDVGFYI